MKAKQADELKKWLDVPVQELERILHVYVKDEYFETCLAQIEAVAHVTYEKEPEKS